MADNDLSDYLEETDLLIQLVRERPALYDRSRPEFKDPMQKQYMWQEIADLLGCAILDVQKKWLSLRHRYTSEHRRMKKNPGNAQSAWPFIDAMSFLEKQIIERRRILPYIFKSLKNCGPTSNVKKEICDSGTSRHALWENNNSSGMEMLIEHGETVNEIISPIPITTASAAKRQRCHSPSPLESPEKRSAINLDGILENSQDIGTAAKELVVKTSDADNADKLFGRMVGAMIEELMEDDKNRAKIHIMSYLCKQGYKNDSTT